MPTPCFALVVKILAPKYDPDGRISILRTSQDPELKRYLDAVNARGATSMDESGSICIKIDDLSEDIKGLCIEELLHALQYLRTGNVPLSSDDAERNHRELEVAFCILEHAESMRLSPADVEHYARALTVYSNGGGDDNA
jgi:hypothetical protein